ncbi:MAG: homoserine dehydrogenase [Nitrososphaerota archaeon]
MRVILVGLGVVGQSLLEALSARSEELINRYGLSVRVVMVADRSGTVASQRGFNPADLLRVKRGGGLSSLGPSFRSEEVSSLMEEVEADVLIDATPTNTLDGEPSYTIIRKAILRGLDVITVSKGALALYFPAIRELASHRGVILRFSGTVGGGMPVIEFGRECGRSDKVEMIVGVLNGTTNYILTRMEEEGLSFPEALADAQRKGYAERDPSLDIKGVDTACKITILANEVLGMRSTLADVAIKVVEGVTVEEVRAAKAEGKLVRLLGVADRDGLRVSPQPVGERDPLAVKGALNSVMFKTLYSGSHTITGKGAGGMETATAILRDLVSVKHLRVMEVAKR